MKRFATIGFAMVWVFTLQAQDCSKSKQKSNCSTKTISSCTSSNKTQTRVVTHTYEVEEKDRKRRFDRLVFMWGAGAHFLPKSSTFAINGRTSGSGTEGVSQRQWQTDALIGIRYGINGSHRRANVIGVFGDLGMAATPAIQRIFQEQNLSQEVQPNTQADFRSLEAGFLFREWLRLSGGVGNQYFIDARGVQNQVNYYTATTGIYVPLGRRMTWTTTATAMFGQDFQNVTIRPATGLAFRLNFMRM
ncbi:MAG: hypothetical protein AB8H47_31390 [Bacteroidia bacterium]